MTETKHKLCENISNYSAELNGLSCPICKSKQFVKNGQYKGNQRYRCSKCRKHFCSTTGNSIHNLHLKSKIKDYVECMNQGLSLRKTAKKIGVSLQTAFRWRHRILSAMGRQSFALPADPILISASKQPYSNKGQKHLKTEGKPIVSIFQVNTRGQLKVNVLGKHGDSVETIAQSLNENTMYVKSKSLPKRLKASPSNESCRPLITQTNKVFCQIEQWLHKFRGVASKYLKNYWVWFETIWQLQQKKSNLQVYMQKCL